MLAISTRWTAPPPCLSRILCATVALAVRALSYEQKRQVAIALRTSVMRLNAWASLVLEARGYQAFQR
jgi:hypothetical protein